MTTTQTQTERFNMVIRSVMTDKGVTPEEMLTLLREAEADGVVSAQEKATLQNLLQTQASGLNKDARTMLEGWLRKYSGVGDQEVSTPAGLLSTFKRNHELICRSLDKPAGSPLTRSDLQEFQDRRYLRDNPPELSRIYAAAAYAYEHFSKHFGSKEKIGVADIEHTLKHLEMPMHTAVEIIRQSFNFLDADLSGYVTESELDTALLRTDITPTLRKAIETLKGGSPYWSVDANGAKFLAAESLVRAAAYHQMSPRRALELLELTWEGFDLEGSTSKVAKRTPRKDGYVDKTELEKVAFGRTAKPVPDEVRAAARYVLDNLMGHFQTSCTIGGVRHHDVDPFISRTKLKGLLATFSNEVPQAAGSTRPANDASVPSSLTPEEAVLLLSQKLSVIASIAGAGGAIERRKLDAVIGSPDIDARLRLALGYLRDNFDAFANAARLPGGDPDKVSIHDIDAIRGQVGLDQAKVITILKREFSTPAGSTPSSFDRKELERLVTTSPHLSLEVKGAISWLLFDTALFDRLSSTSALLGGISGRVTSEGLTAMESRGAINNDRAASQALFDFFTQVSGGKGYFGQDDLRALLRRTDLGSNGATIKAAAMHALESGLFRHLVDLARFNGLQGDKRPPQTVTLVELTQCTLGTVPSPSTSGTGGSTAATTHHAAATGGGFARGFMPGRVNPGRVTPVATHGAKAATAVASTAVPSTLVAGSVPPGVGGLPVRSGAAALAGSGPVPAPGAAVVGSAGAAPMGSPRAQTVEDERAAAVLDREIDSILSDPCLSVEDMVVLVLILIMKEMDRQIEAQLKHIIDLQKMSAKASPNDKSNSIDIETAKLKRLTDKRGQIFDIFRQIVDKYNQTAKSIIDSLGR